jgi:proteasome lid subunit RPN8/RPN11
MTIKISRQTLDEIRAHAEETYPEECCGLLISDGGKRVTESIRMKNAFNGSKNNRYHIDPLEFYKADRAVAQRGLTIAGIYHSHPDHPAILSEFDIEHSFPWYSYVVVAVSKGRAEDTRSWIPGGDHAGITEETLEVTVN